MTEALKPCPFCGRPLETKRGQINPYARCRTEDCFGRKMPVVSLDVPSDVEAWNTRASTTAAQPDGVTLKAGEILGIKPSLDRDLAERQIPETFQAELRALRGAVTRPQCNTGEA